MPDKREYLRDWARKNAERIKAYRIATSERRNAKRRERYKNDPSMQARYRAYARAYAKANPTAKAAGKYGVPRERLELLLDRGCQICGAGWAPGINVRMHVDHDHKTGTFRGVLCEHCNLGIGKFHDDPERLIAAAEYLMKKAVAA